MTYQLSPAIRSRGEPIDLSKDEYRSIARARDGLIVMIGIEQKFELILQNYADYEKELFEIALRQVVFREMSYQAMQEESLAVVRRLGNLLSSAKLYVDSTKRDLSELFGKEHDVYTTVKRKCSEEYDGALGYRLMEALRNVLQHRSIAGVSLRYSANAEEANQAHRVRHRVMPSLSASHLKEADLKAKVHGEIAGKGSAETTGHVRQYVDGLARVHYEVRRVMEGERRAWEVVFRSAFARGAESWPDGEMRASDLVALDSTGIVSESRHIFLAPLEYLASLEKKNAGPLRLAKMYISNASEDGDA